MNTETHKTLHSKGEATLASYVIGFILSVALTLGAYGITTNHILSGTPLALFVVLLAIVQLFVQFIFFLHVGKGKSAKWNLGAFGFTLTIVAIVVGGTLWIMHHLNANMMPRMEAGESTITPQTLRD